MAHVINLNQSEEVRFKFIEQEPNMAYLLDLKQSKYKYQFYNAFEWYIYHGIVGSGHTINATLKPSVG